MPLLKRQPFLKQKLPPDLDPEEELFFCQLTKEVFRDYDEFFRRVILCNSLVWTCQLTGSSGLTYQEALDSEATARRSLKSFPDALKIPVLYLSTLTHRGRLIDMCDDVYGFSRERFFVGEEIEGVIEGQKIVCEVIKVVAQNSNICNGYHNDESSSDVDDSTGNENEKKKQNGVDPINYRYDVMNVEDESRTTLTHESMMRKKGIFTREKLKLFLKQYCESRDGVWKLKKTIEKKCNISVISFSDIFVGPLPKFPRSSNKKTQSERERKREERRLRAQLLREWARPRDDLECDDLKELPTLIPVKCDFPNELFGEAVMVLEFLHIFGELLNFNNAFPHGFEFGDLEKALIETNVRGIFGDLVQFFLQSIFTLQDNEQPELEPCSFQSPEVFEGCDDECDSSVLQAVQAATGAAAWSQRHQGLSLKHLALDCFTVSEVLRLHFLSFGSQFAHLKLYQQTKGSYTTFDDPGLQLRLFDPLLLKALDTKSVFDFNPGERLKVLHVLINQLLNFSTLRYQIEENFEKVRNARIELKQIQWAEQRKEKEEAALRLTQQKSETGEEINGVNHEIKKKRSADEIAQQKRDNLKKRELTDIIDTYQSSTGIQPIGRDRCYRRFWIFDSISGLYVEDGDDYIGTCLQKPTPIVEEEVKDEETSGNEIETNPHVKSENNNVDCDETQLNNSVGASDECETMGKCTANIDNCPVHNDELRARRMRWSYLSSVDQLDALLASLNQRGFRESGLKESLFQDKTRIAQSISQCPSHVVNSLSAQNEDDNVNVVPDDVNGEDFKDLKDDVNLNGTGTQVKVEGGMEPSLREMLLDIEERIFAGSLGSIKVRDRDAWRKAIFERSYDMLCDGLKWGQQKHENNQVDQDSDSGRGTPMEATPMEQETLDMSLNVNQTVKELASALLQIAQGVENKYFRPPLGEDVEGTKKKTKIDSKKGKKEKDVIKDEEIGKIDEN
uniref:WAC domain-containing protein n=1 Tax=Strigamia maritima TaxID=126957 RepID=T1JGD9_STRMM